MINTLHLFNQYLPASENWSYRLIRQTPNVSVHIAARYYLTENFFDSSFDFFPQHPQGVLEIQNYTLPRRNMKDVYRKVSVKLAMILAGSMKSALTEYVQQKKIDVLHAHFADVGWFFSSVANKQSCPYVISFYGWDYEKLPFVQPKYRAYYQQLFQLADAFICEGNHGAKVLEQMGCPKQKIQVIHLGVETGKIPFHTRVKKPGELRLLQIAGFTEKKGQLYTVRAFAQARQECPNLELTLVGNARDPNYYQVVKREIEQLGLVDVIHILPFLDYQLLHDFMKDFHVFIHPSCYAEDRDCEGGAPIILLDAQATGMPVIATRHCDIPEEVVDGETGLLSEEKDIEKLVSHIRQFYQMEGDVYHRFSRQGRVHVQEEYDVRNNARRLEQLYQKLIR